MAALRLTRHTAHCLRGGWRHRKQRDDRMRPNLLTAAAENKASAPDLHFQRPAQRPTHTGWVCIDPCLRTSCLRTSSLAYARSQSAAAIHDIAAL